MSAEQGEIGGEREKEEHTFSLQAKGDGGGVRKVDPKNGLGTCMAPPRRRSRGERPALNFLMIDAQGDLNTSREHTDTLKALFAVSYSIKFTTKRTRSPLRGHAA